MRGAARLLGCSKNTVTQKFLWLAAHNHKESIFETHDVIQIDEMESIEHTKLKPVTIPLAIAEDYRILSIQAAKVPAKGHLSKIALKKYGRRSNEREAALQKLFLELKQTLKSAPKIIRTDSHPAYVNLVKKYFPKSTHERVVSRELVRKKKELVYEARNKVFDPMFALNQRCAKLRADIRRLTRRSWCTTKKIENLERHLKLYQAFNNLPSV